MTSPRLLLAAGTAAAAVASAAPAVTHSGVAASAPVRAGAAGVSIAAGELRGTASTSVVVPTGASLLTGVSSGSQALANRVRLTVVRTSDGATLFTGSLGTFRSLPVETGTKLEVRVAKPRGYAGLRAGATLRWS